MIKTLRTFPDLSFLLFNLGKELETKGGTISDISFVQQTQILLNYNS
jgi:hypothetical protein